MDEVCVVRLCAVWVAALRASEARTRQPEGGRERARQLLWVAGEIHRLQDSTAPPSTPCQLWLVDDLAQRYLDAAARGLLRTRGPADGSRPSTPSSQRARASVLRELARWAQVSGQRPSVGSAHDRGWTPEQTRAQLLAWLRTDTTETGLRTWAVAALAHSGLRVGEITALNVAQIKPNGAIPVVEVNPPGPGPAFLVDLDLPAHARKAVRSWLTVRPQVVVSDRVTAVFLTLRTAQSRGALYARGLPVSSRSLHRAHNRAVENWLGTTTQHTARASDTRHDRAPLDVLDLSLTRLAHHPTPET